MPYTVAPLNTMRSSKSKVMGREERPRRAASPPGWRSRKPWSMAEATPDISIQDVDAVPVGGRHDLGLQIDTGGS